MEINWEKFITVDDGWVTKQLSEQVLRMENKLVIRTYTVRYSGTIYETNGLIQFINGTVKRYVLSDKEIERLDKEGIEPFSNALQYFGNVNPTYDGKYGELILYLLTESILKVPMVVFKIPTSGNEQIKGGDGLFCGNYNGMPAILIGEAKTWASFNLALEDAFKSLNRFYNDSSYSKLDFELFVAKKNIKAELSESELDYLYKCLLPTTDEYKNRIRVHPVLIMYNDSDIEKINAANNTDGEKQIKKLMAEKFEENLKVVQELCKTYKDVAQVYLDFFFIPLKSVDDFKHGLYQVMHGAEWRPKPKSKEEAP